MVFASLIYTYMHDAYIHIYIHTSWSHMWGRALLAERRSTYRNGARRTHTKQACISCTHTRKHTHQRHAYMYKPFCVFTETCRDCREHKREWNGTGRNSKFERNCREKCTHAHNKLGGCLRRCLTPSCRCVLVCAPANACVHMYCLHL
jgi:hypothetical protein